MEEMILKSDVSGNRIDSWLAGKLPSYSRTYIRKLIDEGNVLVNAKISKANHILKPGDEITIFMPDPVKLDIKAENIGLEVLYEDSDIIVVNKPRGMVVHPAPGNYSGTLVNALMGYCEESLSDINGVIRPGIVHRIDRDTSGVLVVAKNNIAHEKLSSKLKTHDIKRIYSAIVEGVIAENSGKIDAPVGRHKIDRKKMSVNLKSGRKAITHFKVLERFADTTYIELQLETGRTHQIRVHMAYIDHPVYGDEVYGSLRKKRGINGQALHARVLGFEHPTSGIYMEFEAELPDYFKNLLCKLRYPMDKEN